MGRKSTEQVLAEFRAEILGLLKGNVPASVPQAPVAAPVVAQASTKGRGKRASAPKNGSRLLFVMPSQDRNGNVISGAVQLTFGTPEGLPCAPSPERQAQLEQWTSICRANGRQSRGMNPGFGLPGRRYGSEEFLGAELQAAVAEWRRLNGREFISIAQVQAYLAKRQS